MVSRTLILAGLAVVGMTPAAAQTAIDGDTIDISDTVWKLWGIDAPGLRQSCNGWPAGAEAEAALADLIKGRAITCEAKGRDRNSRSLGRCRADGEDLGAAMVERGMAWAFVRYTAEYYHLEAKARRENLGVHAYKCLPPSDWRKEPL
jgi:endonuclease YncB( thermonuclease family)